MLLPSRLSVKMARTSHGPATATAFRHVHIASSGHPVRAPLTLSPQPYQHHLHWRCYASSVKNMAGKQLKEKEEAAEAGEGDPGANDHYDKVADTLGKDAVGRMGKALSTVQEALSNMTVRGICPDHFPLQRRGGHHYSTTEKHAQIAVGVPCRPVPC